MHIFPISSERSEKIQMRSERSVKIQEMIEDANFAKAISWLATKYATSNSFDNSSVPSVLAEHKALQMGVDLYGGR